MKAFAVLVLATLAAAVFRHRSQKRRGGRVLLACVIALTLWSWPPVAYLAAGSLEWWFPTTPLRPTAEAAPDTLPQAIVVLSGWIQPVRDHRPEALLTTDSYVRCSRAAWLARQWPDLLVLTSGGRMADEPETPALGRAMRDLLVGLGVDPDRILVEDASRNTYENALLAASILREHDVKRIALVTEAYHMLRAARCFRAQGIEVIPAPCGFRAATFEGGLANWLPSAGAVRTNGLVLHEWLGLVWYRLKGRL